MNFFMLLNFLQILLIATSHCIVFASYNIFNQFLIIINYSLLLILLLFQRALCETTLELNYINDL